MSVSYIHNSSSIYKDNKLILKKKCPPKTPNLQYPPPKTPIKETNQKETPN